MQIIAKPLGLFLGLLILAGCASSGVEKRESTAAADTAVKPKRVVIGEFTATPDRIPDRPEIAAYFEDREAPPTAEEIELGQALGDQVANQLVSQLNEMGIPAVREETAGALGDSDALLEGYFVTIDEGDRLQRMLIGFGAGASELRTLVQVYQMQGSNLVDLGFAEIEAEGGNLPGMLVPVGAGAATGNLLRGAVVGGAVAGVKEIGPETIEAAAERTAEEIAGAIKEGYEKRGWL